MENQETTIQVDESPATTNVAEVNIQEIEIRGGGHVTLPDGRGIPGMYANCKLIYDGDTLQPIRIEPLPVAPEAPPAAKQENEASPDQQTPESEGQP